MTPLKMAAASVAMCALLLTLAAQRAPAPIAAVEQDEMFDAVWIDVMRPLALKNADLERTAYTVSTESKPVVTEERIITPAPDAAPASMPPVVMVQDEEDERPVSRHRRHHAQSICTRHNMRKVIVRGGKSWRCRK